MVCIQQPFSEEEQEKVGGNLCRRWIRSCIAAVGGCLQFCVQLPPISIIIIGGNPSSLFAFSFAIGFGERKQQKLPITTWVVHDPASNQDSPEFFQLPAARWIRLDRLEPTRTDTGTRRDSMDSETRSHRPQKRGGRLLVDLRPFNSYFRKRFM